jgi:hypothetical protein
MGAVWSAALEPAGLKLTALALADWCADDGGRLYPSMAAIAARVGVTEAQARRHVHTLINMGLLSVEANHHGGAPGSTPRYRLHVERLRASASVRGDTDARGNADAQEGLHGSAGRLAPMRGTATTDASQTINNHQKAIKQPSRTHVADAPFDARATLLTEGAQALLVDEFLAFRKSKGAQVTATFIEVLKSKAAKAGWTLETVMREWLFRGTTSFDPEWVVRSTAARLNPADVRADIARATVPGAQGKDPELQKIEDDAAKAAPPPPQFRALVQSFRAVPTRQTDPQRAERGSVDTGIAPTANDAPTGPQSEYEPHTVNHCGIHQ